MFRSISNKNKGLVLSVKKNENGKFATSILVNNNIKHYILNIMLKEKNIVYIQ